MRCVLVLLQVVLFKWLLVAVVSYHRASVAAMGTNCGSDGALLAKQHNKPWPRSGAVPPNFQVAFLGDAGSRGSQEDVLNLVKDWGAKVVFHAGDFEYEDDPELFEDNLNEVLGPDFPYFASVGNHDSDEWTGSNGHQARLIERMERCCPGACIDDYGVNSFCSYQGIDFVLSGVGERGTSHEDYMDEAFSHSSSIWRVAVWHKNQRLYQIGTKEDETGYAIYDTARTHGAILHTAHEHSYCRSYVMEDFARQEIANFNETMNLVQGESFVFVSGLAGESIREWEDDLVENPWWAAVAAEDNDVDYGALLCTFNVDGEENRAHCMFQDREGDIWDEFDILSHVRVNNFSEEEQLRTSMCVKPFYEIAVVRPDDDVLMDVVSEDLVADAESFTLGEGSDKVIAMKFDNIPLHRGDELASVHLQMFGMKAPSFHPDMHIRIARFDGAASRLSSSSSSSLLSSWASVKNQESVVWKDDDEGWKEREAWVSPNLSSLMANVIQQEQEEQHWTEGDAIVVFLSGSSDILFGSYERNECLAPAMTFELAHCQQQE